MVCPFQRMGLIIGSGQGHQMASFQLLPFFSALQNHMPSSSTAAKVCKITAPSKVVAFAG